MNASATKMRKLMFAVSHLIQQQQQQKWTKKLFVFNACNIQYCMSMFVKWVRLEIRKKQRQQ